MKRLKRILCLGLFSLVALSSMFASGCKDEPIKNELNVSFDFEFNTTIPDGENKDVKVVILSGQSNATGVAYPEILQTKVSEQKYSEYLNGYDNVWINYNTENGSRNSKGFVKTNVEADNWFGPEIGLAETLSQTDDTYFILKYSYSGSDLYNHWEKENEGLYKALISFVNSSLDFLRENNYNPTIKALCWMQGESDSSKSHAKDYYNNLKRFVKNIREDLGDMRFIDAGISDATLWKEYKKINEAKERFSKESDNNYYFSTIDNGIVAKEEPYDQIDYAHYDSLSTIKLGQMFAEYVLL